MTTQDIAEIIYAHTSLTIDDQDEVHATADVLSSVMQEELHNKAALTRIDAQHKERQRMCDELSDNTREELEDMLEEAIADTKVRIRRVKARIKRSRSDREYQVREKAQQQKELEQIDQIKRERVMREKSEELEQRLDDDASIHKHTAIACVVYDNPGLPLDTLWEMAMEDAEERQQKADATADQVDGVKAIGILIAGVLLTSLLIGMLS